MIRDRLTCYTVLSMYFELFHCKQFYLHPIKTQKLNKGGLVNEKYIT